MKNLKTSFVVIILLFFVMQLTGDIQANAQTDTHSNKTLRDIDDIENYAYLIVPKNIFIGYSSDNSSNYVAGPDRILLIPHGTLHMSFQYDKTYVVGRRAGRSSYSEIISQTVNFEAGEYYTVDYRIDDDENRIYASISPFVDPDKREKAKNTLESEYFSRYAARACGEKKDEINFSVKTDKTRHPIPDPEPGKAIVYVIQSESDPYQAKLAMDGKWMGTNRGNNYFYFTADPGEHFFCSNQQGRIAIYKTTLEPNKSYFLLQKNAVLLKNMRLILLQEQDGRKKLENLHLSVFEEKKKK